MKKYLLLLAFMMLYVNFLAAQVIFPTYADQPIWCMAKYGLQLPQAHYTIELKADTLLCGQRYNPVWVNNEPQFGGGTFTGNIGYTRTKGPQIFFRRQDCTTPEILVCDFSLQTGDTIRHFPGNNTDFGIIAKVDTVLYAGVARKSLLVYYPIFRDPFPPLLNQRIWVEGIGNTYDPFDQADCLDGDCEYETALICLSTKNTIIYGNCVESCKIDSLTNNDEILVNHARWSVLPNPVALNQPITIRSTIQKSATGQLLITNVMGQIVFKQPFNLFENQALISISWSPSTAGMYWLIWQNEDGSQQMTPFIAH